MLKMTAPTHFSAEQLEAILRQVYRSASPDSQAAVLGQRRLVVAFAFQDPELFLTVDGRSGQAVVSAGTADVPAPDLTFHLAGENIDRFWRGELNAITALTAGQLRIDGSLITALTLAPALPGLQARYRELTAQQPSEP